MLSFLVGQWAGRYSVDVILAIKDNVLILQVDKLIQNIEDALSPE